MLWLNCCKLWRDDKGEDADLRFFYITTRHEGIVFVVLQTWAEDKSQNRKPIME